MKTAAARNAVFEPFLFREYGISGELFFYCFLGGNCIQVALGSRGGSEHLFISQTICPM